VQDQVAGIRSSDEMSKVATGFAAGGLAGGLQGLQSVFAGRQVADERDSVLAELDRRLKLVSDFAAESDVPPTETAVARTRVPSPLAALPSMIAADDGGWLWLSGSCQSFVPLSLLVPPGGAPLPEGLEGQHGSATAPLDGPAEPLAPPTQTPRSALHAEEDLARFGLPRLPW
jgi:hypothetical protein